MGSYPQSSAFLFIYEAEGKVNRPLCLKYRPVGNLVDADRRARCLGLGDRPNPCHRPQACKPVDLRRPVTRHGAGEIVELDPDRRRVDLGERQVVLGSLGAEEASGHSFELEPSELLTQLATAQW